MGLAEDLPKEVESILATKWKFRDGLVVPEPDKVLLGNDAVKLDATVLYADLAESTDLVNRYPKHFAAEVYKSYLHCATKLIRASNGVVRGYPGTSICRKTPVANEVDPTQRHQDMLCCVSPTRPT